jgi:cell division septal protein FtsQ
MGKQPGESEAEAYYREAREAMERRKLQWTVVFTILAVVCGLGVLWFAYVAIMVMVAVNSRG